jgi:hypothetical protein
VIAGVKMAKNIQHGQKSGPKDSVVDPDPAIQTYLCMKKKSVYFCQFFSKIVYFLLLTN